MKGFYHTVLTQNGLQRHALTFFLLLTIAFWGGIHRANAQVTLGLNTTIIPQTPKLGEPFQITISYGVISNVTTLNGGFILVDFPVGVSMLGFSPTSHISYPLQPGGLGSSPEIIIDPIDNKRKLKIYFIDPLPSGSAGDIIITAVIKNTDACPLADFDIATSGYILNPAPPNNLLTFSGMPAINEVIVQGTNNWNLDLVSAVTVCSDCPAYGGSVIPVITADRGWVPADYVNVVVNLPSAATNISCPGCSSIDLLNKKVTYNLGVPNENNNNVILAPNLLVPNALDLLELPQVSFCLPAPAGVIFPVTATMEGAPRSTCINLPDFTDNVAIDLTTPLNPTSGVICDYLKLRQNRTGAEGDLEARFYNGGQTCLDSMRVEISIPISVDVVNIPMPSYTQNGIDVQVLFTDNNGTTGVLGTYVTGVGGSFNALALAAALTSTGGSYFTKFTFIYKGTISPGFGPDPDLKIRYKVRVATDQLGNPIVGANPRIPRGYLDNCGNGSNNEGYTCILSEMDVTGYNGTGPTSYICNSGDDEIVRTPPEGIHKPVKSVVGSTDLRPGETGKYQINFQNCSLPSNNVSVFDVLDPKFTFDPSKVIYSLGLTILNAQQPGGNPLTVTPMMNGSTLLTWNWANIPAPTPGQTCSEIYTITYEVGIPDGTPPGNIGNCIVTDWDEASLGNHPNGSPIVDPTPAQPILGHTFVAYAPDTCNYELVILSVAEMESRKGVKGSCDPNYPNNDYIYFDVNSTDPLNGIATAYPGAQFKYKFELENTGNVPIGDLVIIDIFPSVGDEAVSAPFPRGSQFSPSLVELILLNPVYNGSVQVYYTTASNPCRPELITQTGPYNPANCTQINNWTTTPPADISLVKAIKIEFINGFTLEYGEKFEVEMTMQVPANIAPNLVAWNSFAYQGARADPAGIDPLTGLRRRIPVAEPTKVGLTSSCVTKLTIGNYVWIDNNLDFTTDATDNNGLQDAGEPGVNGVKATLWRSNDNIKGDADDAAIDFTYTAIDNSGNDGYYLFSILNPDPNQYYYVVFDITTSNLPAGTIPTLQDVGMNDAIDSDADPVMFMTSLVGPYSGGAEDLTLDMGLIPGTVCTVVPEVRIICDNKGTSSTLDDTYAYAIKANKYANGVLSNTGTYEINVDIQQITPNVLIEDIDVRINLVYGTEYLVPMQVNMGQFGIANFDDLIFRIYDRDDISCRASVTRRRPATLGFQNVQAVDAPNVAISTCLDDGMGNLSYNLEGTVVIGSGELPSNAKIEVYFTEVNSGNIAHSQVFTVPGSPGTIPFSFANLKCDGDSYQINARFIDMAPPMMEIIDPCNGVIQFNEPCWLDITDVQIMDECRANGTYTVTIKGTYYNAPGNMSINIAGTSAFNPATKTLNLANLADGVNVTLQTFTKVCDGQLHTIAASFAGNSSCSDNDAFEGPRDRDFGDVPNTFGTTLGVGPDAAFHLIHNDIYLGACVDSELNGAPQAKAGVDGTPQATSGAGGDDATIVQFEPGEMFYHTCANDDEDGVRFITPMVQGNQACIEVTATSTIGAAKLDMWVDFNGNGSFNSGEKVVFVNNTVPSGTSTQQYCFTVPVTATFPNQYTHIRVRLSTAGVSSPVGVAFDGEVEDYYLEFAKIGDYVWEDLNIDGEQDNGEPGIPNSMVSIAGTDILNNPYTATVQTSASGMYMFNGLLPGTYTVTFATPPGFFPTKQDNLPGNDMLDSDANPMTGVASSTPIMLNGLDVELHIDAGFWGYASIGDYVWKDRNADGIQNGTEPGIENVKVTLTGTDFFGAAVMLMDFTDTDGKYLFDNLVPGDYKLTFTKPLDHYTTTLDNLAQGEGKDSDADPNMGGMTVVEQLLSSEHNRDYDAGYFTPVAVGDLVWLDAVVNGLQDIGTAGEVPLANFTVELFTADGMSVIDVNGLPVGPVTTLTDGLYMFMNLRPGDYIVRVTPPVTGLYSRTISGGDPDNNNNTDSNGELLSGNVQSQPITLLSDLEVNDGDADDDKNPSVDFGFTVQDYGDLPNTYGTTGPNGPRHTADARLKLGVRLDGEANGQPEAMAGAMTGGDDNNNGIVVAGTAGDDEDGVMLISPLIPGSTATIMVDAMNMTTSAAVLQGWIDWNGDGDFDIPAEELTFTNADGGTVPSSVGLSGAKLTFAVPANAIFASGNAFMRFRLSPTGGLMPGSQTAPAPIGEIEDYKTSLAKLGNLVFNDQNFNGLQDATETGINGVSVTLIWAGPNGTIDGGGDDVTYTSLVTGSSSFQQGEYYFCGVTNGTYKIIYATPDNMTPTRTNEGIQANGGTKDSDGSITGMNLTMAMETFTITDVTALPTAEDGNGDNGAIPTGTFPDAQTDETHDQGFAFLDYGDLPQNPPGDDFNTTMAKGGAVHVMNSSLKLGATVDAERDGTPSNTANGDDASNTGSVDDEDGIVFATPLIPGNNATITVTAMNMTGANATLQGWIDWNNDGILSNNEALVFSSPAGGVIASPAGVTDAAFTFAVPPAAIFNDGMVFARFRLSPTGSGLTADGPDKYNNASTVPQGEVEDYKLNVAKVGNYVWEDRNFDGLQGTAVAEPPLNGVSVQLIWLGTDGAVGGSGANADVPYTALTTGTGFDPGEYYYCGLTPGNYKLVYGTPIHMTPSPANQGSQTNGGTLDSDGAVSGTMAMETFTIPSDVTTLPTAENGRGDNGINPTGTFPDNQTDETHDQGFALLDYGDLPDGTAGTGAGDYQTQSTNGGAVHVIVPGLKIGSVVDGETNGNQSTLADGDDLSNTGSADDEEGFNPALPANMLVAGLTTNVTIPVMNTTTINAKLVVFIDFDNDGDFGGVNSATDEMVSVSGIGNVANVMLNIPVPANSVLNTNVGMRIRFSTDANFATNMSPNGMASDGEVEDYIVQIMGYDWGDLADGNTSTTSEDNYVTQNGVLGDVNDGPSHKIRSGLKLGASVDAEGDGQQSLLSNGDDTNDTDLGPASDDEDGVLFPNFTAGIPANITVNAMNMTGGPAKLFVFIDWNNDGDFGDLSEAVPVVAIPNDNINPVTVTVTVTPPLGFTSGLPNTVLNEELGARFRLSTDMAAMNPIGNATDGEVEDYLIIAAGYDWGDLNDNIIGNGTATAPRGIPASHNTNDGTDAPRHKILTDATTGAVTLKIGAVADVEAAGQSSITAGRLSGGDDAANLDDEDGLNYATMPLFIVTLTTTLTVQVMNMTTTPAKLVSWTDFNKDGDFTDAGEMSSVAVGANFSGVVMLNIPVPAPPTSAVGEYVGLRLRLTHDTDPNAMLSTGQAESGEVEDYEVQIIGYDYGDQPNTYGTLDPNAPRHIISENLKLGTSVDAEIDGNPDAMAGLMGGGDDGDPGLVTFGTSTPGGDDENGVMLTSPMLPGYPATFMVDAMNMTGNPAVLQAWADFDGDGTFGAGEALIFTNVGGGAVPSPTGLSGAKLTFDVPANATFKDGNAHVRFRLSPAGNLAPDSQTDPVPFGEIEDYKFPLGKVGNYVWEDRNFDGLQGTPVAEPAINGVSVTLTWAGPNGVIGTGGDDVTYAPLTTGAGAFDDGEYYYCGLIPGTYKLVYASPTDMTPTKPNRGSQVNGGTLDSDGDITGMDVSMAMEIFTITDVANLPTAENGVGDNGTNPTGTFPDRQVDETHDQGFAFLDYGDLPPTYSSKMIDGGPSHVIIPELKMGISIDGERDAYVPDFTAQGDDVTNLPDENGIIFPPAMVLAPGGSIILTVSAMNMTGAPAVIQGWIDWDSDGVLEPTDQIPPITVPVTGLNNVLVTVTIPTYADFDMCTMYSRFRLSPGGGLGPNGPDKYGPALVPQGEVEDYRRTIDITIPTIICPANVVKNTEPGVCGAVATYPQPMHSDDCSGTSLALTSGPSTASGAVFPVGVTSVNWTVTNGLGYTAVCNFIVIITDNQPPKITCPKSFAVNMTPGRCDAPVSYNLPVVTDNCPGVTLTRTAGFASGALFPKGPTVVTHEVRDGASNVASCSFTVTVNDAQAPLAVCPSNQAVNTAPNSCIAKVNYVGAITDNCPGGSVSLVSGLASGADFPKGVTTVVLKATDASGLTKTCSFKVTVTDNQAPVTTCPADVVKNTDLNKCTAPATYAPATFTDNCPGGSITRISGLASGSTFPKGTSVVVWRATDAAGLTKTCSHKVTVNDNQLPVITCPANIVKDNDFNVCCASTVYAAAAATDNCPGVTSTLQSGLASGSLFPVGTSEVVWKATDASGLTKTCKFTVTVNDKQAPMLMCPGNVTVAGGSTPCGYASANLVGATVMMDNCWNHTLTSNAPTTLPVGATTIQWTAVDLAGNMSQCAHTVTVTCTTAPGGGGQAESRNGVELTVSDMGLGLLISPNPATSQVTFRMEGVGEKGGDLTVFDQLGRMVWEQSVTAQQQQAVLELSQFATGAYQVRLRTEHGMVTKGLVVSKL